MIARHVSLGVSLLSLAVCAGCANCCRPAAGPAAVNVGVGVPSVPPAPMPVPAPPGQAPGVVPQQQIPQPPPFPSPAASNFGPPPAGEWQDTWRPTPPEVIVRLSQPEPLTPGQASPRASLSPPDLSGQATRPPAVSGNPAPREDRPPALPSGIPQFAAALGNRVTAGLKPLLDGLDWLQANGYRTVLKVRRPGEDDEAERRQVERRGMKLLVLEVSPQTLNRQTLDEFIRLVGDAKGRPLFVYDRDGALAGGLWYLYYRVAERSSDEVARVRASALGLRDDQDGSHRDMWLAVQKLVGELR